MARLSAPSERARPCLRTGFPNADGAHQARDREECLEVGNQSQGSSLRTDAAGLGAIGSNALPLFKVVIMACGGRGAVAAGRVRPWGKPTAEATGEFEVFRSARGIVEVSELDVIVVAVGSAPGPALGFVLALVTRFWVLAEIELAARDDAGVLLGPGPGV